MVIGAIKQMKTITARSYRRTLLSYTDILGFADMIEASKRTKAEASKIAGLLIEMQTAASRHIPGRIDPGESVPLDSLNFSDLTVRATSIPKSANLLNLIESELFFLSQIQLSFALKRVLLRGGVCIGDIYADEAERIIFGPALVKAYTLESQYAVYPRIVIDRDLIWLAKNERVLRDYFRRGDDGAYFLNYLFVSVLSLSSDGAPNPLDEAKKHKKAIEALITDGIHKKPERVKQKLMWLALYHNSTVEKLRTRLHKTLERELERCFIPQNLLRF